MAKKNMIQREIKRAALIQKYKRKRKNLKEQIKKAQISKNKLNYNMNYKNYLGIVHYAEKENRCWMTGRSKGFYRDFGLSRHVLREMAHDCLIPGLHKSSW
uniref:Ribosomal protein S14 n=1 Tax=Schizymenia dubyi TaxID=38368 RepID=A0A1C9C932_9FLOR|nr:ribosomal protein S14 [Schizymenia dubyi]AOM64888.1 ribosomal protein S14 [Schizymenia dubyi]